MTIQKAAFFGRKKKLADKARTSPSVTQFHTSMGTLSSDLDALHKNPNSRSLQTKVENSYNNALNSQHAFKMKSGKPDKARSAKYMDMFDDHMDTNHEVSQAANLASSYHS